MKHESSEIWCDNIAAVTWVYKLRNNNSKVATNILRALATRLHQCKAGLLSVDHISGCYNMIADVASRKHTKDLTKFLQLFTNKFLPPQNGSLRGFVHSDDITCKICLELLLKTSTMGSWRILPTKGSKVSILEPTGLVLILTNVPQTCENSTNQTTKRRKSKYWFPTDEMLGSDVFLIEKAKFVR